MSGRPLKVGNYQMGERLGEGTFGTVVKATHAIAGERVAVKVLEKKRMQQADDIERVGREIQILKLLKHPYVVRLWEIIYERDRIYLSMECALFRSARPTLAARTAWSWVERVAARRRRFAAKGELFQHIVKHRRCREPEARRFFVQIMSGVAYLHAQVCTLCTLCTLCAPASHLSLPLSLSRSLCVCALTVVPLSTHTHASPHRDRVSPTS